MTEFESVIVESYQKVKADVAARFSEQKETTVRRGIARFYLPGGQTEVPGISGQTVYPAIFMYVSHHRNPPSNWQQSG